MTNVLTTALLLSAALVAVAAAEETSRARPDLTGHWVLNEKASDLPRPGGGSGRGGEHDGPGGGFGGGRGMRSRRMGLPNDMVVLLGESELVVSVRGVDVRRLEFGGAGASAAPTGAPPGAPSATAPPATNPIVLVTPEANPVALASPDGVPAAAPAAPPVSAPAAPAIAVQVPTMQAHWDGARIVSEFENRRGGKTRETWELAKDGRQLVVRTTLPAMGERPDLELKHVYDRVEQK